MLRCSRLTRAALLSATLVRRSALPTAGAAVEPTKAGLNPTATGSNTAQHVETGSLQHSKEESNAPSAHLAEDVVQPPPLHHQPKFLLKGRRGNMAPEYYSTRSNAGHPDAVAELLGAGRDDPEWMWLKLLCFLCVMATFGTTLYGYFFAEHVKYFLDEPWSRLNY
ncbi:hypothetical protein ABB37_03351 [Leptomonas pyrrhocoris]|uniref:Uncharacterized protein n=1 Tax=Leptomonas pyrrhocoris TaxID=157538 RepID=A0A0M9G4S5_LEPPY|nr:hypothetical protein ABB37_03351 [Leptomonas pyrrhocoris]KPA82237.1 hypothetical protein ABB37_03351 [Leptomonas pyrrhocoris]|eukprot:XP_015660676.1 hypothetical protein ABB37_03351 [Leptomonas pyrrhocoris]